MMARTYYSRGPSEEILLPAKSVYLTATLLAALLLNFLPFSGWLLALRPDFVALILLYWGIRQPRKLGFLPAWLLGLAMDVSAGSLFGQHALAYSVLMFAAIGLHRRISMFDLRHQMLHVLAILLLAQVIVLAVRAAAGGELPGWWYFLPSLCGTAVWPLIDWLVKLPLRPRPDPDQV